MSITAVGSVIFQDIADITRVPKDTFNPEFMYEVKLHTVDKDLDHYDGLSVNGITIFRDYVNNMSDYIEVSLSCMLGTYVYDIYEHLDNIEVTLYVIRQLQPDDEEIFVPERYKAVYLLERNSAIPTTQSAPRENMNQELPVTLTLQLIDRSSETVRIKTLQGSFDNVINPTNRDMSVGSFLKSLISTQVDMIQIESRPAIDKVEIETPHNTGSLLSVTIPSGTRLVELPEFIQNKSSGIYTSGVGNYVQRYAPKPDEWFKTFFVYSLYDAAKYHTAKTRIIFYSPPTSSLSLTDNTYLYEDDILKVLVNTTSNMHDTKESLLMSTGVGFRSSNSNSMMKKPVRVTPEGPEFVRSELTTEVIHKDRSDGLNFAPYKKNTSNHFASSSEVMSKIGKYVRLIANNVDIDFFYPGASCKIVYVGKDDSVQELFGVIHRIKCLMSQPNMNLTHMFNRPRVKLSSQIEFEIYVTE